jgi:sulfate adenylyltransferase subunit 2
MSSPNVTDALEAESIDIFGDTAAAFQKPAKHDPICMDASVLLRLARKAFAQGPTEFSLTHMHTTRKLKEVTGINLSARATRLLDGDKEDSMEKKKTEGYF